MRHGKMFITNKPSAKMRQNGSGMTKHRIACIEATSSKMREGGPGVIRQVPMKWSFSEPVRNAKHALVPVLLQCACWSCYWYYQLEYSFDRSFSHQIPL